MGKEGWQRDVGALFQGDVIWAYWHLRGQASWPEGSFWPCGVRYNARRMGPVSQRTLEGMLWSLGLHREIRKRWKKSQGGEGLLLRSRVISLVGGRGWRWGGSPSAPLGLPLILLSTHKNQKNCRIFHGIVSASFGFIPFAIRNLLSGGGFGGGQPYGLAAALAQGRRPPKAGGGPTKYHQFAFRNSLHQVGITFPDIAPVSHSNIFPLVTKPLSG